MDSFRFIQASLWLLTEIIPSPEKRKAPHIARASVCDMLGLTAHTSSKMVFDRFRDSL